MADRCSGLRIVVKCDRRFPACTNCRDRKESCDLENLHPDKKAKSEERDRADAERIQKLEAKLVELQNQVRSPSDPDSSASEHSPEPSEATTLVEISASTGRGSDSSIGQRSLDWRLATPQMAASLSRHLVSAFFDSCCFLMPSFQYFRANLDAFKDPNALLPPGGKAAVSAFLVIGARASPHSALLGLPSEGKPSHSGQAADALSAGARRQNACLTLFQQAHEAGFEQDVADEATVENLASTLALFQMSSFVELQPRKSRTLVRAAVSHFRELQDRAFDAGRDDEAVSLRRVFALAVYAADAITAAYSRRASLLTASDLETYFGDVGIVIPSLPEDDLSTVLASLSTTGQGQEAQFQMANHLAFCWTCAAQRMFAKLAAPCPPPRSLEGIAEGVRRLWIAVDKTRAAILELQDHMRAFEAQEDMGHHNGHTHGSHGHQHDQDYFLQAVRVDRDLLDLDAMVFTMLQGVPQPGLPDLLREAESRVRRGLRQNAWYLHVYTNGPDRHMTFHHVFQLEHNPRWPQMALQKCGEPGGPATHEEELTEQELNMLATGLEAAAFYTPLAEKRLRELRPARQLKVEVVDDEGQSFAGHGQWESH